VTRRRSTKKQDQSLWKKYKLPTQVIAVLLAGCALAALLTNPGKLFPEKASAVITVYRTADCPCAFEWMTTLRKAGLIVRSLEEENLSEMRASMQVHTQLAGCHLGVYLDYFIEGHVQPPELKRLAEKRPVAAGLAAAVVTSAGDRAQTTASHFGTETILFDRYAE
jgi:hypothetical protein